MPDVSWAEMALAKEEVLTACSEEGALGSEGCVGLEWGKEFLRMPGGKIRQLFVDKGMGHECTFWPLAR